METCPAKRESDATWQNRPPALGRRMLAEPRSRAVLMALLSFVINAAYALYNGALGFTAHSYWFLTLCAYHLILGMMRAATAVYGRARSRQRLVQRLDGVLLLLLAFVLAGSIYLSDRHDVALRYDTIPMITITTFTFAKMTLAIVNSVRARRMGSRLLVALRNIGVADALASMLTMQRSMLVSFGGGDRVEDRALNLAAGIAVIAAILLLGVRMLGGYKRLKPGRREEA